MNVMYNLFNKYPYCNLYFIKGMGDVPSTFPREKCYNYSTEESESDVGDGKLFTQTNAFGEAKTSRHNRPPRCKRLEKQEKIATCKSKRILQMHEAKKELDKVNINIHHKYAECNIILFHFKIKYSIEIFFTNIR